jgi:hypothetical protein
MGIKVYRFLPVIFFLVSGVCPSLFAELFVSRLCEYPEEQYSRDIYIVSEDIYIDIAQNYGYTARYMYLVENKGEAINISLGFFLRPYPQSGEGFEARPEIRYFKINDEIITPIITETGTVPDNSRVITDISFDRIISGWIYIPIQFDKNEVVKIELSYASNCNHGQYGQGIYYESYPFLLKTADETVINMFITNNWDDIYFTNFISKSNIFENSFNSFDELRRNKVLSGDLYAISKLNENSWIITVSHNFVKRYTPFFGFILVFAKSWSPSGLTPYFSFTGNGVVIFPRNNSFDDVINVSETPLDITVVIFMTKNQLRLLRNAFYARHHYPFRDKDLQSFFEYNSLGYYSADDNFNEALLTNIERMNIDMIKELENACQTINYISKPGLQTH